MNLFKALLFLSSSLVADAQHNEANAVVNPNTKLLRPDATVGSDEKKDDLLGGCVYGVLNFGDDFQPNFVLNPHGNCGCGNNGDDISVRKGISLFNVGIHKINFLRAACSADESSSLVADAQHRETNAVVMNPNTKLLRPGATVGSDGKDDLLKNGGCTYGSLDSAYPRKNGMRFQYNPIGNCGCVSGGNQINVKQGPLSVLFKRTPACSDKSSSLVADAQHNEANGAVVNPNTKLLRPGATVGSNDMLEGGTCLYGVMTPGEPARWIHDPNKNCDCADTNELFTIRQGPDGKVRFIKTACTDEPALL